MTNFQCIKTCIIWIYKNKARFTLEMRNCGENLSRAMAHPWEASLSTWRPLDVVWSEKGHKVDYWIFKYIFLNKVAHNLEVIFKNKIDWLWKFWPKGPGNLRQIHFWRWAWRKFQGIHKLCTFAATKVSTSFSWSSRFSGLPLAEILLFMAFHL
jgi:hypothetical protein